MSRSERAIARRGRIALLLSWLAMSSAALPADTSERPFGLTRRIPLTTSRVIGSPEPPLPFRAKRAFPSLSFNHPVYVTAEPASNRLLVVEQNGRTLAFGSNATGPGTNLFHEIADHETYSLRFHPGFATNRFVYVFANGPRSAKAKHDRILRYTVSGSPARCDPASETVIIEWLSNGHNGGEMDFGPDGMLYISAGDGTSDSDGLDTGQDLRDIASGVLRINVDKPDAGRGYSVPQDNPFLHIPLARPELWAFGFRNPWRLSFDRKTGDLWVGDIGQDLWEMVYVVKRGANYGWSVMEGSHPFHPLRARGPVPISKPSIEHPHSEARSITGGTVYTGDRFKDLRGAYIYGDYGTGKIWAARYSGGKITWHREIADTPHQPLAFAQGHRGEILYADYGGALYELEPNPPPRTRTVFPRKLGDTGLFADVPSHTPQPALIPYSVNSPLWSDDTHKDRFIALPGLEHIEFTENGAWKFPEAAVLVKTFSLEVETGNPASRRRIETRLLVFQQNEWVGYTYAWNAAQTDADLVAASGADRTYTIRDPAAPGGIRRQSWHLPSRAECMVCHSRAAQFVLGLNTHQMNRQHDYDGTRDNQLRAMEHIGLFKIRQPQRKPGDGEPVPPEKFTEKLPKSPDKYARLADPHDATQPLEARARSYLHSNCAHCHVDAGGGNAAISLHINTKPDAVRAVGVEPLHDKFSIPDARIISPGSPGQSVLLHRISTLGPGRMPPLASSIVDDAAVKLIRDWIAAMPAAR
ncbi:MAG: hypothetical protein FJ386_02830 [Verrucomicrobia bacterium]|nr:hypothetical protein [Verrucomicrobiota bacterium]